MRAAIGGGLVGLAIITSSGLAAAQGYPQQPQYPPQSGHQQPGQQQPGQQQPGQQQPAGQQPGMTAGGLAPPDSMQENAEQQQTERQLAEADEEDSGRGLEFVWLEGEIGYEHVGLNTFSANDLVDAEVVKSKDSGLVYGAAAGVRLIFITLGARFRLGQFTDWDLWTLNAELGIRIPLGNLEPHFTLGGGYASMGSFGNDNIGQNINTNDVDITGYNIRGGFGLDYYITSVISLGAEVTGELMALTRPGVSVRDASTASSTDEVYAADGSSTGSGVTGSAVLGLHF